MLKAYHIFGGHFHMVQNRTMPVHCVGLITGVVLGTGTARNYTINRRTEAAESGGNALFRFPLGRADKFSEEREETNESG